MTKHDFAPVIPQAPYTYILKATEEEESIFYLFILIKVPHGQSIIWPDTPSYKDGFTSIECTIEGTADSMDILSVKKRKYKLSYPDRFDEDDHIVNVTVKVDNNHTNSSTFSTKMFLTDSDHLDAAECNFTIIGEKAINAPYLYLTAGEDNVHRYHIPRCLIFLSGDLKDQDASLDDKENFSYKLSIMVDHQENDRTPTLIENPQELYCNKAEYYDHNNISEGKCSVEVIMNAGTLDEKKRKGVRPNKDIDIPPIGPPNSIIKSADS